MSGKSNCMHDELIGAGASQSYINIMKLKGWLPIKEYFEMRRQGIELDWVLILTMEDNGFQSIPMVAEYCIPFDEDGPMKPGWYKDDIDNPCKRIDDWTNVIMFKTLDNPSNELNEFGKDIIYKEKIENQKAFYDSLCKQTIEYCIDKSNERFIKWERSRRKQTKVKKS